jgi:formylglycine-generating enzyme required for sulfatase activity
MLAGFEELVETLDLDSAKSSFYQAEERLKEADGSGRVVEYAQKCRERLEAFQETVARMAPVRGGAVVIPGRDAARGETVESFFIDRWEVSVKEYREFMDAFGTVDEFDKVRDLWPSEQVFERYGRRDALRPRYFLEIRSPNPSWPIEDVKYHQAEAYLRWKGKSLPTLAEWFLAAKGRAVGGKHRFDVPSVEIYTHPERPTLVTKSGTARGFPSQYSVHHLAGNVAEWCKAEEEGAQRAPLVGGRYLDTDRRYFTGERRDYLPLDSSGRGYGFRGVARPKDFFAGLLPKGPGE